MIFNHLDAHWRISFQSYLRSQVNRFKMNNFHKKLLKRSIIFFVIALTFCLTFQYHDLALNPQLENILQQKIDSDQNIFFIETSSGSLLKQASLTSRQACSVESAALTNPNAKIFLIFSEKTETKRLKVFSALSRYRNIFFSRLDLEEFSKGTKAESWVTSRKVFNSSFITESVSDFLRLLLLWRFDKLVNVGVFNVTKSSF